MRLTAENLAGRRGEDFLFSGISFALSAGDALIVTGKNGSGKSTLLRAVAGLLPAEIGHCEFRLSKDAEIRPVREASHYLGHRNAMKRELTVEENLLFWKDHLGDFEGGEGIAIEAAADAIGLEGILHLPYGYLSAGQQRRFAMAKLLVAYRPVWILDEPTAALDSSADQMFAGLVRAHLQAGGMALAATHQPLGLEGAKDLQMKGFEYADLEHFE